MRLVIAFVFALSQLPLLANAAGVYLSTELGGVIGTSIDTQSRDTDYPTLCDKVLDPNDVFTPPGGCPEGNHPEGDAWRNGFGRATGFMAGAALGYSTDLGLRVEAEYFRVSNDYSETSDIEIGNQDIADKSQRELVRADERIGRVTVDSVFANVYYDLPVSGALRPYLGGGVGFEIAKLGYDSVWARNNDPARIETAAAGNATYNSENGTGNEEADRQTFHERVAGTTTTASKTLRDTVFGYQAVIGADYMLTDKTSIGLKGRWVKYATFEDGGNQWDQLRSHDSTNNRGDTVVYTVKTDDLSSFGVSIVMKYAF